jgi:ribonuclease R
MNMAGKGRKKKQAKRQNLSKHVVMQEFKDAGRPLARGELLKRLGLKKSEKEELLPILGELESEGKIMRIRGGTFGLVSNMNLTTGTLEVQRSGVGFVIPEDKRRKDIFISPGNMDDAWHGDKVAAAVFPGKGRGKNPEGRVARVLERGLRKVPCRVLKNLGRKSSLCRPTDPKLGFNLLVDTGPLTDKPAPGEVLFAEPGDKLESGLWAAKGEELLGEEEDVEVQEKLVKASHGVPQEFPRKALEQAADLPEEPAEADFRGREDLRGLELVTIDGAKAKDFDDAVYVEKAGKGFRLIVAIADVAHYVAPGSPLDREALERGNSYYFPQSVEPMFPEALSNGLCSLNPNVPRLAVCAEIDFDGAGRPRDERFYPAVIKSHARLTYSQVQRALFENNQDERMRLEPLLPMLGDCEALARKLSERRKERGSLDFDLPEPEILFNIYGEATDIRPRPRNFAHQIIEEFMIAANEAVARRLENAGNPCLFRVHPEPDREKLRNLFKMLEGTELRAEVPKEVNPKSIQALLQAAEGTNMEFLVNRLVLRSMMQAEYDPRNIGHYGLASECYCHFTSPIRRYADLLNHRSLKSLLAGKGAPRTGDLSAVGNQISKLERKAMEAEREILKRLTILFLRDKVGESFTGVINGVSDFGFWVELEEVMAEGLVRLSTISDDYYVYLADRMELVGERTGRRFRLGRQVKVRLADVNLPRLEVNLELLESEEEASRKREKSRKRRKPGGRSRKQGRGK